MSDVILRVFFAMVVALAFGFIFIHYFILLARKMGLGQSVRLDGPKRHLPKEGIPTAAGLVIWSGVILSACLWANLKDTSVQIALWVILSFGCIGFVDDVLKIKRGEGRGFSIKNKLLLQGVVALATAGWIYIATNGSSNLHIPVAGCDLDLGLFYILFAAAVIFFFSNAVNLTDGLDGMVTVPSLCTMLVLLLFCYIGQVRELMVVLGAASGSLIAFLWYFLQIFTFRLKKKRIFKMAPLHHHYELKGWPEPMVVVKFWIISIILAAVSVGVLRIG